MKLRRNETPDGTGKYCLIKLDQPGAPVLESKKHQGQYLAIPASVLDFGETPESEFFVLKLKDVFAGPALLAYGKAVLQFARDNSMAHPDAIRSLEEYAWDVIALSERAMNHPKKRLPT